MSDVCIVINQRVAEQLAEVVIVAKERRTVIPNGIDPHKYRRDKVAPRLAALPEGRRVIGTAGGLSQEKGTEDLLQAARRLSESHPDIVVCVVGDGPLKARLEAQAWNLGIQDRVGFTGVVEDVRWARAI